MSKRVLVTGASNIGKAGVATIVYKWGQAFDPKYIVYDYLMQNGLPDEEYQDSIRHKGGKMYTMSNRKGRIGKLKWVENIIRQNKYKIIHINSDSAYVAAGYIYAAKKAHINRIYVHSHCTQIDDANRIRRMIKTIAHKVCMPYVVSNTEMYLACSKLAGEWMFGKKAVLSPKYRTIFNGIEVDRYLYDTTIRETYRKKMGFGNNTIIANIGRLSYQKNQAFLIDVFSAFQKKHPSSLLVIVGIGELEESLKNKVHHLNLDEKVKFLGLRNDIPSLLCAFDVLVMPSRFEGLPVTMVEAQMSSLPCVVSDNITDEAKFTEEVCYVKEYSIQSWIEGIERMLKATRVRDEDTKRSSSFNINNAAQMLSEVLLM